MPLGSRVSASIDKTTFGLAWRLRTFVHAPMCAETISSPSTPTHITLICGVPSGFTVAQCANFPEESTARAASLSDISVAWHHVCRDRPGSARLRVEGEHRRHRQVVV